MFSQKLCLLFFVGFLFRANSQVVDLTYDDVKDIPKKPAQNPSLKFEPSIPSEEGLIYFRMGDPESFTKYIDRFQIMQARYNEMSENVIDCSNMRSYRPPELWNKSCRFDIYQEIGDTSLCNAYTNYGYDDALPCIALTLNKGLNWLPKPYNNHSVPGVVRERWATYSMPVSCVGEDPVSKDNVGPIRYYPEKGFKFLYFPNTGQSEWLSPIVFINMRPMPGIVVRVTCTAYASNIKHNIAKVSFDLMVD